MALAGLTSKMLLEGCSSCSSPVFFSKGDHLKFIFTLSRLESLCRAADPAGGTEPRCCPPAPPALLGWGGELEEHGRTLGLGQGQLNRAAEDEKSTSSNTDKGNTQVWGTHGAPPSLPDARLPSARFPCQPRAPRPGTPHPAPDEPGTPSCAAGEERYPLPQRLPTLVCFLGLAGRTRYSV